MITKVSYTLNFEKHMRNNFLNNLNWTKDENKIQISWENFDSVSFFEMKRTHYNLNPSIFTERLLGNNHEYECNEADKFVSFRLSVNFKTKETVEFNSLYLNCMTMDANHDNSLLNEYLNEMRANKTLSGQSNNQTRSLVGNTSATGSTISYSANIVAFTSYTITVTARDSSGNARGVGNDIFWIYIENQCSKATAFSCDNVSNQRQVLQTEVDAQMTDNLDGTYSYTYSVNLDGTITMYVLLYTQYGVYAEYFNNIVYSGTVANYDTLTQMSKNFGGGLVTSTQGDCVSANFYFKIQPLISDTYTIYLIKDDYGIFYLNGVAKVSGTGGTHSFSQYLNMNQFYSGKISWVEQYGSANIELDWSYTSRTQIAIPSQNLYYPAYVASSPYNIVSTCPFGYTGYNSSSPTICKEICGDGYRIGVEECDDKNTNSNDGCSSTCTIESGWVCFDGSSSHQDTCRWCIAGFYPNSSKNDCILYDYSNDIKKFTISFGSLLLFCIIICIADSVVMKMYSMSTIVHQKIDICYFY